MYIKIKNKEVKTCEKTNGDKTLTLHLKYKIGDLAGEINVIDYEDNEHNYKKVLKQLKQHIKQAYKKSLENKVTPLTSLTK